MRILPEKFKQNTFDYELVKRSEWAAIYSQSSDGKFLAYEAIRIQHRKEITLHGNTMEAGEWYPSSSSWGADGFTYHSLSDAEQKFNFLNHPPIPKEAKCQ